MGNISNHYHHERLSPTSAPLDYQHPHESMRRDAELLALKYQKLKENEP
jgi:hypothetical protein